MSGGGSGGGENLNLQTIVFYSSGILSKFPHF